MIKKLDEFIDEVGDEVSVVINGSAENAESKKHRIRMEKGTTGMFAPGEREDEFLMGDPEPIDDYEDEKSTPRISRNRKLNRWGLWLAVVMLVGILTVGVYGSEFLFPILWAVIAAVCFALWGRICFGKEKRSRFWPIFRWTIFTLMMVVALYNAWVLSTVIKYSPSVKYIANAEWQLYYSVMIAWSLLFYKRSEGLSVWDTVVRTVGYFMVLIGVWLTWSINSNTALFIVTGIIATGVLLIGWVNWIKLKDVNCQLVKKRLGIWVVVGFVAIWSGITGLMDWMTSKQVIRKNYGAVQPLMGYSPEPRSVFPRQISRKMKWEEYKLDEISREALLKRKEELEREIHLTDSTLKANMPRKKDSLRDTWRVSTQGLIVLPAPSVKKKDVLKDFPETEDKSQEEKK